MKTHIDRYQMDKFELKHVSIEEVLKPLQRFHNKHHSLKDEAVQSEIIELVKSGCKKPIKFNCDLQYVDDEKIESVSDIAEQYGLGMAQGFNGYIEIWVDDEGRFRCQATEFSSVKTDSGRKGIVVPNGLSLQIGTKLDTETWLKFWWPKLNDLSNS